MPSTSSLIIIKNSIFVFGAVMLDYLQFPVASYPGQEPVDPTLYGETTQIRLATQLGGVGYNLANKLAAYRINRVAMTCLLGEDLHAIAIRDKMSKQVARLEIPVRNTGCFFGTFDTKGNLITGTTEKAAYREFDPVAALQKHTHALRQRKTWVLESSFNPATYEWLSNIATQDTDIYVVMCQADEAKNILPILAKIRGLFCNKSECLALASAVTKEDIQDLKRALDVMVSLKLPYCFITDAENGVYVINTEDTPNGKSVSSKHFPALSAKVVCVNGAGDAFAASTITALLHGHKLIVAVNCGLKSAKDQVEGASMSDSQDIFAAAELPVLPISPIQTGYKKLVLKS